MPHKLVPLDHVEPVSQPRLDVSVSNSNSNSIIIEIGGLFVHSLNDCKFNALSELLSAESSRRDTG